MNKPPAKEALARVAERRLELLTAIAAQRQELAEAIQPLQKPLAVVDAGLGAVRFACRHPALLAVGAAALLAMRRKSVAGLFKLGWRLLRRYASARWPSALWSGVEFFSAAIRPTSGDHGTKT